jgi:hypothetical protein
VSIKEYFGKATRIEATKTNEPWCGPYKVETVVNCCGSVVGIQCYIHINRRIFLLLFKQMSGRFMFLIHDEVLTKVA